MNSLNNERGNITLIGIFFLFSLTSIFYLSFYKENNAIHEMKIDLKNQICIKKISEHQKKLIREIEKLNKIIKVLFKIQTSSAIIPGMQSASVTAKNLKKVAELTQQTIYFSYIKNLYVFTKNKCPYSISMLKTPYMHQAFFLKRNFEGVARIRSYNWEEIWRGKKSIYKLNYKVIGQNTKIKSLRIRN